jgi:hypothetical protein
MAGKKISELSSSLAPPLSGVTAVVHNGTTYKSSLSTLRHILVDSGSHMFTGGQFIGGNLIVSGSVTAQQFILSSSLANIVTETISGSSNFGNSLDDRHIFTGSVRITGSLNTIGDVTITGKIPSLIVGTGSFHVDNPEILHVENSGSFNISHFQANNEYYAQVNIKNTNSGSFASTDLVLTADNGSEVVHYANFGINSSTYNGGAVGLANDSYLMNAGKDLYIGTLGGSQHPAEVKLFTMNNWFDPQITLHAVDNGVSFNIDSISEGYTYEFSGSLNLLHNINVDGITSLGSTLENIISLNQPTTEYTHDFKVGSILYVTGATSNISVDVINVPTNNNKGVGLTVMIEQGLTPYLVDSLQINSDDEGEVSIMWFGGSIPDGNATSIDVISFSMIKVNGSWKVFGQLTTFEMSTPAPSSTPIATITPTRTITPTPSVTPTITPTQSATSTVTPTPTSTVTPPASPNATPSETATMTPTPTMTPSETPTATPSGTPGSTPSETPTETPTMTPSETPTATPSETPTMTPSETPTATPSETPTMTPSETPTATPSETPTATPSETPTATPSETPTMTMTPTMSLTPTQTATPSATLPPLDFTISSNCMNNGAIIISNLVGVVSGQYQYSNGVFTTENDALNATSWVYIPGGNTALVLTLASGTFWMAVRDANNPSYIIAKSVTINCVTPTPTATPSVTPSETPSMTPTMSETPTMTPSETPTPTPSETPTMTPSETPTMTPSETPTATPSETPTMTPSETPTPTMTPTGGGSGVGSWYFYSDDEGAINVGPPIANGNAIFTINTGSPVETFNPNKVDGVSYLYFNAKDSTGTSYLTQFAAYTGGTGTITISQNGDTVTYTSSTLGAFVITGGAGSEFFAIATSACTQTKTSNAPYVYADPISITFGDGGSTPTPTMTPTMTATPSETPTMTPSETPTMTPTMTMTPSETPTMTPTMSITPSQTPTMTPTMTMTPSPTMPPITLGDWYLVGNEGLYSGNTVPNILPGGGMFFTYGNNNNQSEFTVTYNPNFIDYHSCIRFNTENSTNVEYVTLFESFRDNGGTMSLTQNGNTARYSFNPGLNMVIDLGSFIQVTFSWFGGAGGVTQTQQSPVPFVNNLPITITLRG